MSPEQLAWAPLNLPVQGFGGKDPGETGLFNFSPMPAPTPASWPALGYEFPAPPAEGRFRSLLVQCELNRILASIGTNLPLDHGPVRLVLACVTIRYLESRCG